MADERDRPGHRLGEYKLGPGHDAGPGLGRLHEARHVDTGRPALILMSDQEVEWPFEGNWRVILSGQSDPGRYVKMEVDQAPASVSTSELVNLYVMATGAAQAVEDNPQVQAHLARGPMRIPQPGPWRGGPAWRSSHGLGLAAMALLTLAAGLWLRLSGEPDLPVFKSSAWDCMDASRLDISGFFNTSGPQGQALAYPIPPVPFRNQEKAPCRTKGESAINGGCWVELAQKPPCEGIQAEYQGKCYLPMVKVKDEVPQAQEP